MVRVRVRVRVRVKLSVNHEAYCRPKWHAGFMSLTAPSPKPNPTSDRRHPSLGLLCLEHYG